MIQINSKCQIFMKFFSRIINNVKMKLCKLQNISQYFQESKKWNDRVLALEAPFKKILIAPPRVNQYNEINTSYGGLCVLHPTQKRRFDVYVCGCTFPSTPQFKQCQGRKFSLKFQKIGTISAIYLEMEDNVIFRLINMLLFVISFEF